ncbi:MAG: hypothetical protein LBE08_10910, partial [Bifidobacteriaceae bacterium]|nr:hypothetical protein [Bifidobacteriaceae bacterium]
MPRHRDTKPLDVTALRRLKWRRRRLWLIPAVVVLVILGGGYVAAAYYFADRVPKGATVAGVHLGGLTEAEAIAALGTELAAKAAEPVPTRIGSTEVSFDPVIAGIGFSPENTVGALTGLDFNPVRLWDHIAGIGAQPLALVVDRSALEAHLADLAAQAAIRPVNATLSVASGAVVTAEPTDGAALDEAAASA